MEPKKILTIHNGEKVVPTFTAAEDIARFPFGPEHNIVAN